MQLKYSPAPQEPFSVVSSDVDSWPIVTTSFGSYRVHPVSIGPIAIGDAELVCLELGCELPSPELVDAIYEQADLRIEPVILHHDGTAKTMASSDAYKNHRRRTAARITEKSVLVSELLLIAGTHKDVVKTSSGKVGLYGWKRLSGENIQGLFLGHGPYWIDYSQGVRPVKKIEVQDV